MDNTVSVSNLKKKYSPLAIEEKLARIEKRKAELDAEIDEIKNKPFYCTKKEDTRLKILIGTALLADLNYGKVIDEQIHQAKMDNLKILLNRYIHRDNDRVFLTDFGLI
jgi:hypothetical protein